MLKVGLNSVQERRLNVLDDFSVFFFVFFVNTAHQLCTAHLYTSRQDATTWWNSLMIPKIGERMKCEWVDLGRKMNWGWRAIRISTNYGEICPKLYIHRLSLDVLQINLFKCRFVLLKERNMLMTMEEACKEANEIFPNPERLDKIEDSMNNLESIVRERNRAYHLLETGETGERPGKLVYNCLGIRSIQYMLMYDNFSLYMREFI